MPASQTLKSYLSVLREEPCLQCQAKCWRFRRVTLQENSARLEYICTACNLDIVRNARTFGLPCFTRCPACEEPLFDENPEPLKPTYFGYPCRCKKCEISFYYSAYQYRIQVMDRGCSPERIVFEGSFGDREDASVAETKYLGTRYVCATRGPGWSGGSMKLTEDEFTKAQAIIQEMPCSDGSPSRQEEPRLVCF
jgi:hypothetical protein